MKKMFLAALISVPIFLTFFIVLDARYGYRLKHVSIPTPAFITALRQQWEVYQGLWEHEPDDSPKMQPSPTPYPPLAEMDRQARLAGLFQSNGGCRLPCWWGIVPGQTTWQEVHAILSPPLGHGAERGRRYDGFRFINGYYYEPTSLFSIEFYFQEDRPIPNLLIEDVPQEYLANLTLSNIFRSYGSPDEIYIRSPYHTIGGIQSCLGEFEIFLYYPSQGFAIQYRYQSYPVNRPIRVCDLDRPSFGEFYVWTPGSYSNFQEVAPFASWGPGQYPIQPIEEETSWTTESFFATFRQGAPPGYCIDAPAYDWDSLSDNRNVLETCEESYP